MGSFCSKNQSGTLNLEGLGGAHIAPRSRVAHILDRRFPRALARETQVRSLEQQSFRIARCVFEQESICVRRCAFEQFSARLRWLGEGRLHRLRRSVLLIQGFGIHLCLTRQSASDVCI